MTPDSEKLEACPFCGSTEIDAKGWASLTDSGPACDDCGASSGSIDGKTNVESWNTRAPDPRITHLEKQVAEMRGALEKHARHDGLCGIVGGYGYCTCGLDAILNTTKEETDGQ